MDLHLGIDLGTTTVVVSWKWSTSREKHILKFKSPYTEKANEELDATLARSRTRWFYGLDTRFLFDVVVFENIKLGIIGQDPYLSLLKGSFLEAREDYGTTENPVTLFEQLFLHILDTLEEQFLDPAESQHYQVGRAFDDIRKQCWVTYPVRHNESLKITLVEAALAAGFDGVDGVSESLAAAHFAVLDTSSNLLAHHAVLIVDCGGGSTVWPICFYSRKN